MPHTQVENEMFDFERGHITNILFISLSSLSNFDQQSQQDFIISREMSAR